MCCRGEEPAVASSSFNGCTYADSGLANMTCPSMMASGTPLVYSLSACTRYPYQLLAPSDCFTSGDIAETLESPFYPYHYSGMAAGPMAVGEDMVQQGQPQWLWTSQGWIPGWTGWSEEAVPHESRCEDGGS